MYCYLIAKIEIIDEDTQEEFQTGFLHPDGTWNPDMEYRTRDEAAMRINFLNGGIHKYDINAIRIHLETISANLEWIGQKIIQSK